MRYRFAFIDSSAATYVVACKECPHWSAIRLSQAEAYRAKAEHDTRVHDVEEARSREAQILFARRSGVS